MNYSAVATALETGAEPSMLCATCPWDRYCISPPSMTKAEVDAQIAKATAEDTAKMEEKKAAGTDPGLPLGGLLTALTMGGRDRSAEICPVFALRLRSSNGRGVVDALKSSMLTFDDQA